MSERRERILDAARGLIVDTGLAGVSMHAIARAAGVTRPALYAEFCDRDELFEQLLDREEAHALAIAAQATPELGLEADPLLVAEESVDLFLDMVLAAPETWRLVLMPGDGMPPSAQRRIERVRTAIRERTHFMLTVYAALRESAIDTELLSHGVISASETAARLLVTEPDTDRAAVSGTLRWLVRRAITVAEAQRVGQE